MSAPNEATPQNPILTYYNEWVDRTPFVTRTSLIVICIIYLLSWFISADTQLGDVPYFTIMRFEVYRILTSPLVGNSIFSIILIFLFFPQMGGKLEYSMGSGGYLLLMGTISILTNIAFLITCFLLYLLGMPQALFWNCSGFWVIIFAFITIECMMVPDAPRQLMFIPINIPSKYFPLVLYAIFTLFSGPELSFAISMAIGFLCSRGYLDRLKLSSTYVQDLEGSNGCFHGISRSRGWMLATGVGHDSWIPVNTADPDMPSNNSNNNNNSSSSALSARGGSGPGFPNIGGFNSLGGGGGAGGDEENGAMKKDNTPFPGSGRTLTNNTASSGGSMFGSGSSSYGQAPASKEAIAQRRLVALGALNSNQASAPPLSTHDPSPALQKLLNMGFVRSDAVAALERSNGDLTMAMQHLTT